MDKRQKNQRLALILLIILAALFVLTQTAIGAALLASPWWVYFVIAGILLSGYLSVKYSKEEREFEQEWIEKEGNVYMERLAEEKARRIKERS
ncbi:sporulation YhaL family protein [Alkalihalophilus lindianensis]|jgi:predicted tellurium resistance membrane protein TerC|uniref:Sporulation YhaL family protein n=1 Tax=Alkalihalophilus lindianensis TaxID=1630542 RepID=A0ABU3XF80_9BACI|nr:MULTISPECIES: sporulation YhaL family protein [Bacillaceae]MDV2686267.1 sporulation YhaL family protein [Alkalihalophilus lindianensis]